jgi:hypothetical protein
MLYRVLRRILKAISFSSKEQGLGDETEILSKSSRKSAKIEQSQVELKPMNVNDLSQREIVEVVSKAHSDLHVEIQRLRNEDPTKRIEKVLVEAETMIAIQIFMHVNRVTSLRSLRARDQFDLRCLNVRRARIITDWIVRFVLPYKAHVQILAGERKQIPNSNVYFKKEMKKYLKCMWRVNCKTSCDNPGVLVVSRKYVYDWF